MNPINTIKSSSGRFCKRTIAFITMLFASYNSFAQPDNNDPCTAAVLPVTATCSFQTFTTIGATLDLGFPVPGCAGFTSASFTGTDVWFQFTVPAGGAVNISTEEGTLTDGGMAIYSGDCNVMAVIECNDDAVGTMPYISRTGLTPGSTIFIRFWKYPGSIGGSDGTFGICVTTPPPAPGNDNCGTATPVPVNTDLNCTQFIAGSTASATQTTGVPAPSCGASGVNDDVWYSFVATAATHVISLTNITGNATDMAMSLYSGTSCAALTHVQCSDPETMIAGGLTLNTTYYVRVWTWSSDNGDFANFRICVGTPPPPPANDEPCNATLLTANNTCVYQTFSNAFSTATTSIPDPACGNYDGSDIWFRVVVPAEGRIRVGTQSGVMTDAAMAIYSGTCTSMTELDCSDDVNGAMPVLTLSGLTPGSTLWIRIWEYGNDNNGTFGICVSIPPPPPANDNPCTAIPLVVAENGSCTFQQFTNESATGSTGLPDPGCAGYDGGDVWFTVVVPCSGSLILDTEDGQITDGGMAIYRGTCSSLTLIDCDDDGSTNASMPRLNLTGLVPGETLWVRVWELGNNNNGTFGICAQAPPPPPPAATCQTAQSFCTSSTITTVPNITGQPNENGGGAYGCLLTIPNPTYYYLQIQNSGSIQITISQTNTAGDPVDVDFIVWGPFNSLNATCAGINSANIVDCSYLPDPVEIVNINAVAGQYYLFLVTNYSDEPGTITYQQTGGTGSSDCSITCTLSASNSGPICSGQPFNLTATNVTNATYQWTGPNCFSSTQQNPSVTTLNAPITPGQYVYTVTATTPTGQACQDTTIVTVAPKPALGVDSTLKICAGSTANLNTFYNTAGLTNAWTLGGVSVANPSAVNVTGIYRLVSANATGCTDTAFVNLTVDTVRSQAAVAQIICTQTGRITVTNQSGIAPFQYSISSNPGVFQPSNEFVVPAGNYTITTRDSLGCTTTSQATVTIVPELTVNAGADVSIVTGETVQLLATVSNQPNSILWTPSTSLNANNVLNPRANPTATTTYTIAVTNSLGCAATDDVTVTVIPYCVKVKNAFTPNGDGINEAWEVYDSYDCLKNVTVQVFNRYGKKVFESRDYRNKWLGNYDGKPVPDGTYYAVVDFTFLNGKKVTVKSDLTILR